MVLKTSDFTTPIFLVFAGHSASNGAALPKGSTVVAAGNNDAVAKLDPTQMPVSPLPADMPGNIVIPVVVGADPTVGGSVDFTVTVTAPDGSVFTDVSTLVLTPQAPPPPPGLTHIVTNLVQQATPPS